MAKIRQRDIAKLQQWVEAERAKGRDPALLTHQAFKAAEKVERLHHPPRTIIQGDELPAYIGRLPSPGMIQVARKKNGRWSRKQLLRWGLSYPPPAGWQGQLRRAYFAALEHMTRGTGRI